MNKARDMRERHAAPTRAAGTRPLVVCAREDTNARGLFVVSSLYHCVEALASREILFLDANCVASGIAIDVLAHDCRLDTRIVDHKDGPDSLPADAALFVAVGIEDDAVRAAAAPLPGVPQLVAVQFPVASAMSADILATLHAAHDPRRFGELLARRLGEIDPA